LVFYKILSFAHKLKNTIYKKRARLTASLDSLIWQPCADWLAAAGCYRKKNHGVSRNIIVGTRQREKERERKKERKRDSVRHLQTPPSSVLPHENTYILLNR
jgi:hypothetical protein